MSATTLFTDRLSLRPYVVADLDDAAAMWADARVTAMIGGRPFTREEVWQRLLRYIGHWHALGWGTWTVRDRATDAYLGEAVLMDSRRDTRPSFEGVPEAGWALAPEHQGRGYAREAVAAMLAWADARGFARTVCVIDDANARSVALAEGLGYRFREEVSYRDAPIRLFERRASEEQLPQAHPHRAT